MTLCKKISFLIIISLIGLSCVSIGNCFEDTEYLVPNGSIYYDVEMIIGDNLTWSFETYLDEFEVRAKIIGPSGAIILSEGLTTDSGIFFANETQIYWITFTNSDVRLSRSGFIDIYYEVNVEPEPTPTQTPSPISIPSFNPLIIISIIGSISGLSAIIIKKRIRK